MYKPHFSYNNSTINLDKIKIELEKHQINNNKSKYACEFQHNIIPVYDLEKLNVVIIKLIIMILVII